MGNSNSWNSNASGTKFLERKKKQAARMMDNHYSRKSQDYEQRINMSAIRNDLSSEFDNPLKLAFSETKTHKGLRNLSGENNCFLNATIQALWHLGPFRYELQKLISKAKLGDGASSSETRETKKMGLLEALCNLFVQYQYTELSILPPTELRETLSDLFKQFQLGEIADANETLEAILETIHVECTPRCCHNKHNCLAHNIFGGLLMEQSTCLNCSASSAPMLRSDFVHYVYAAELIALGQADAKRFHAKDLSSIIGGSSPLRHFGHLLHECMGVSPRCCPSLDARASSTPSADKSDVEGPTIHVELTAPTKCDGKADVKLYALEPPMALAISIGWTQTRESLETLSAFLSLVSYTIELGDLFDLSKQSAYNQNRSVFLPKCEPLKTDGTTDSSGSADPSNGDDDDTDCGEKDSDSNSDDENRRLSEPHFQYLKTVKKVNRDMKSPSYVFRGFVCYYGLHYISIFQEQQQGGEASFLLFDDQKIRPLGGWEEVKKECLKSMYQPVLLLYELQDTETTGTACSNDDNTKGEELVEPMNFAATSSSPSSPSSGSGSVLRQMYYDVDLTTSLMASGISRNSSPAVSTESPVRCRSPLGKELLSRACTRSRTTSSAEILSHIPPIMPIKIYEVKQKTLYVTLKYDFTLNRKLLGFEHGVDEKGRIVFVGFQRHPESGKMLPAELSQKIGLLDQILAVDHTLIENYTTQAVTKLFTEYLNDKTRKSVMLTVKSAQSSEVWFRCPYCDMEERISAGERLRLVEAHRNAITNGSANGNGNVAKAKDDVTLTVCETCRLKGSTDSMFLNGILS